MVLFVIFELALAFRDQLLERRARIVKHGLRITDRLTEPSRDELRCRLRRRSHENLRMKRGIVGLPLQNDFLEQLLAGSKASENDLNFFFRMVGQADEIASEIDDFDRLSHVEHEDLSIVAKRRRLQNQ